MTSDLILYAIIGAGLLGSVLGVFIEKPLVALLAPLPLLVVPMGVIIALRSHLEGHALVSADMREMLVQLAHPAVLLQMALACFGGALAGALLARLANGGEGLVQRSAGLLDRSMNVKRRGAAMAERTTLQKRTHRLAAAPRPAAAAAAEPLPIYDVAPALTGLVSASSVADISNPPGQTGDHRPNRRKRGRRRAILAGFLILEDNRSCPCRIVDVSDIGARVRLPTLMALPEKLWLLNTSDWMAYEVALAWRKDADAGLNFLSKRDLRSPTTDRDHALHALCADLTAR